MKQFLLMIVLVSISVSSWAGWVSSGGELFKDAHNPWFVKNTKEVSYCVETSPSVTVSKSDAQRLVKESIQYWLGEFKKTMSMKEGHFVLGGQTFVEVPCSSKDLKEKPEDIRFLFGFETLSKEEAEWLKDPRKYIGITVRTDYDETNLKGKGFVYISSDFGEHAYHNSGNLIEKAWQHEVLLKYALLHELGHVFGFAHMGTGLMSEVFLEQILNKNLYQTFLKIKLESFIHPDSGVEICGYVPNEARNFFGLDPQSQCLQVDVRVGQPLWNVYSKKSPESEPTLLGSVKGIGINILDFQGKPAVVLQLTEKQKVFTPKETAFRSFMYGPMLIEYGSSATFVPVGGKEPKPVYLKVTSSTLSIIAATRSKVEPVLGYHSPLGIALLISPVP